MRSYCGYRNVIDAATSVHSRDLSIPAVLENYRLLVSANVTAGALASDEALV